MAINRSVGGVNKGADGNHTSSVGYLRQLIGLIHYRGLLLAWSLLFILMSLVTSCSAVKEQPATTTPTPLSLATVDHPATQDALPPATVEIATPSAVAPTVESGQLTVTVAIDTPMPKTAVQQTPSQSRQTIPSRVASPAPAVPLSSGQVVVQTDHLEYVAGQEISVSLINGLDTSITTLDQQSFCSIFRLEKQDGPDWQEVRNCLSGPPPVDITIEPGMIVSEVFPPDLEPGIYRVGLAYTIGAGYIPGDSLIAYSQPFRVN